jgi:large subunit ribosomal protein L32e
LTAGRIPRRVLLVRRKRPRFVRQESWRYIRLKEVWRRPKGIDSRMRLQKSGAPPLVKVGYRTPKEFRHIHPSGYREILVHNLDDLRKIKPETEAARIASGVGLRKRIAIYEAAKEAGIRVLNPPKAVAAGGGEGG